MRRRIPSTQALACFEAAARHESYTRAADELALSQGAVSRQIAALEQYLGSQLFRRTRHGVVLTPCGADYARHARRVLATLERATLDAAAWHGGGSLTLATVPTFATRWLIPRLPRLTQRHPDLVLHLETRTRPFMFGDTDFDAAIYAGTPEQVRNWAGTRATLLMHEEVLTVCSPHLPGYRPDATPADIARLPLLQQSTRPQGWRQWFDAAGVAAPDALRGPRYELFSMTAMAAMHGAGVALVPRLLIEDELARGDLVEACAHRLPAERNYYLVSPAQREEGVALGQLSAWLADEVMQCESGRKSEGLAAG